MRKAARIALVIFLLTLILLFSFYIRQGTFWISHWMGDQSIYLGLAMKMDRFGFSGYNIRGIDIAARYIGEGNNLRLLTPIPAESGRKGTLLEILINSIVHFQLVSNPCAELAEKSLRIAH